MNLLKKSYIQRALQEEAKGSYQQAAALYSRAGEFEKVGEMHELLGDMTRSFPAKIRAYQQALRWYKEAEHREAIARKLATTMEVEIRADQNVSSVEEYRLPKVAEYYAMAKAWDEAGRIYEELGLFDNATEMYIQGGNVDRIEQNALRKERHDHRAYSAQQYYEDSESAYHQGKRDIAYQAVKQSLTLDPEHLRAKILLDTLERELRTSPRRIVRIPVEEMEYTLFGKGFITIGRREDNDIVLAYADVSRCHARVGFRQQSLILEDLKSSNGTRVNGLRIQQTAELRDHDVVTFGRNVHFEVCATQSPSVFSVTLCPKAQQTIRKQYVLFQREVYAGTEAECAITLPHFTQDLPSRLLKIRYQQPFWYIHFHPRLSSVELNGVPVKEYVVISAGDTLQIGKLSFLFE